MSPFRAISGAPVCRLLLLVVPILAACGHEPARRSPNADTVGGVTTQARNLGETAATIAVQQIGVPYRYGGSSTGGFDCSGLAQYAYARAGVEIPRTTAEQWRAMNPVEASDLAVGDVLFFRIDGTISHVGVYLGDARFVHAPSSGREVSIADLNSPFYAKAFVRGGRPR